MGQPACLEKMTSAREQDCLVCKGQAFKALAGLLSIKSDNKDYKDFLRSKKPRPLEAPSIPPEAFGGAF